VNRAKIFFDFINKNGTRNFVLRYTPLIYAAVFDHVEVVRVLLEGGACIESADVNPSIAMHQAALNGYLDMCRLLLNCGAEVDPVNWWKETPLH
jgi:ankyrin repeat protein